MDLRRYLTAIAQGYDRHAGPRGRAQPLLRSAPEHLQHLAPAGYMVIGSGGKGRATFTPWFGFFDPDETSSPEEGLYVAYLFAADLNDVSITVMQGITTLDHRLGRRQARERLTQDAVAIRTRLQAHDLAGLNSTVSLRSSGFRQVGYEAGCVLALTYSTTDLPNRLHLERDLRRFLRLHELAIGLKRELLQTSPGEVSSPSAEQRVPGEDPLRDFKPKNEADYVARLVGQTLVKTRRHERLIRQYGEWLTDRHFALSTSEHPKDLVIRRGASEWLVEAKIVKLGRAMEAVRAALGQLYTYKYFLYRDVAKPRLTALFSEPVGDAFVSFLAEHYVEVVWYEAGQWLGSAGAVRSGLASDRCSQVPPRDADDLSGNN